MADPAGADRNPARAAIWGGDLRCDSLPDKKPHPAPVLEACRLLGVDPAQAVMVGDDARDIEAARAAGTRSVAARFGYCGDDENPDAWNADAVIDRPAQLIDWLDASANTIRPP
ncbi:MAG: HAD-IA family hydrolase [Pseudomonadota bacterium]|nr:HAD-IA family hydrolase [Pseudomonadota bacterium]